MNEGVVKFKLEIHSFCVACRSRTLCEGTDLLVVRQYGSNYSDEIKCGDLFE